MLLPSLTLPSPLTLFSPPTSTPTMIQTITHIDASLLTGPGQPGITFLFETSIDLTKNETYKTDQAPMLPIDVSPVVDIATANVNERRATKSKGRRRDENAPQQDENTKALDSMTSRRGSFASIGNLLVSAPPRTEHFLPHPLDMHETTECPFLDCSASYPPSEGTRSSASTSIISDDVSTPSRPATPPRLRRSVTPTKYRSGLSRDLATILRSRTTKRRMVRPDRAYYVALQHLYGVIQTLGLMHGATHDHRLNSRQQTLEMLLPLGDSDHREFQMAVAALDDADAEFDRWLRKASKQKQKAATPDFHQSWVWFEEVWRSVRPTLTGISWPPYVRDATLAARRSALANKDSEEDFIMDNDEGVPLMPIHNFDHWREYNKKTRKWCTDDPSLLFELRPVHIADPDRSKPKPSTKLRARTTLPAVSTPSNESEDGASDILEPTGAKRKREDGDDVELECLPAKIRRRHSSPTPSMQSTPESRSPSRPGLRFQPSRSAKVRLSEPS